MEMEKGALAKFMKYDTAESTLSSKSCIERTPNKNLLNDFDSPPLQNEIINRTDSNSTCLIENSEVHESANDIDENFSDCYFE